MQWTMYVKYVNISIAPNWCNAADQIGTAYNKVMIPIKNWKKIIQVIIIALNCIPLLKILYEKIEILIIVRKAKQRWWNWTEAGFSKGSKNPYFPYSDGTKVSPINGYSL